MKTIFLTAITLLTIGLHLHLTAQTSTLTGKVTCKTTGEEIKQISVVEQNTGIGTISSENGVFSLVLKPGATNLLFSDAGYEPFNISFILKSDTVLNVSLNPLSLTDNRKIKKELHKQQ